MTLPRENRHPVIAVRREKALSHRLDHADQPEQQRKLHPPDPLLVVTLSLTDDLFLCSSNWACWQPGRLLPVN